MTEDIAYTKVQSLIVQVMDELKDMLLEKNRKYGNAALEPIRVFSKSSAKEQILVRIDDKINRMMNRQDDEDEDINRDLIGYLVLSIVHDRIDRTL